MHRIACGWLALLTLTAGCAAEATGPRYDDPHSDAGERPGVDGGAGGHDAGATSDAGGWPPGDASGPQDDAGGMMPAAESDSSFGPYGCFNGRDDDRFGAVDCGEESCASTPACCVGSTADRCCTASSTPIAAVTIGECTGPITSCAALASRVTIFGPSVPTITSGGIIPVGSANSDSGLFLDDGVVDPRAARVQLRASMAAESEGCGEGCVDGTIVALTASQPGQPIEPLVAVMVSGSRRESAMLLGDDVVAHAPLPDALPHDYELTVRPDGGVTVASGDWRVTATIRLPDAPLRVVVYGRSFNPAGRDPARLLGLEVRSFGCDVPSALTRRGVVLEGEPMVLSAAGASQPHVAVRPDGQARMAMVIEGAIFIADAMADGSFALPVGQTPALVPAMIAPGGRLADPFLVPVGDAATGHWVLLYAGLDAEGNGTLLRARGPDGWGEVSFDPYVSGTTSLDVVLSAERLGEDTNVTDLADVASLDGPTALVDGTDGGAGWIVIARARLWSGASRLVMLRSPDTVDGAFTADPDVCRTPEECETAEGALTRLATLHETRSGDLTAFDQDEVAAPAIVRTPDGLYRIYYAGRRGTRWAIGMLHSADLRYFSARPEPVLRGSGSGWDMLGVSDPSPLVDESGALRLFHVGTDGARTQIGVAEQSQ